MDTLEQWIVHRARVIGLSWPDGLAEAAGVPRARLVSLATPGQLRRIGRSARGYLARALKVSVRELEDLAAGKIAWIDDARSVDLDRLSPYASRSLPPIAPTPVPCRLGRGVPILGRVLPEGIVETFENWTAEDGPRLPTRYRGVPDAFALELTTAIAHYPPGARLAFRNIAPGELLENELGLLTFGSRESETRLCRVSWRAPQTLALGRDVTTQERATIVPLADVLRAARIIDAR